MVPRSLASTTAARNDLFCTAHLSKVGNLDQPAATQQNVVCKGWPAGRLVCQVEHTAPQHPWSEFVLTHPS